MVRARTDGTENRRNKLKSILAVEWDWFGGIVNQQVYTKRPLGGMGPDTVAWGDNEAPWVTMRKEWQRFPPQ